MQHTLEFRVGLLILSFLTILFWNLKNKPNFKTKNNLKLDKKYNFFKYFFQKKPTKIQKIVIEGLDGSGKTTIIQKLKKILIQKNKQVILLQGLGSSSIGKIIREPFKTNKELQPLTRYFLSFADLYQLQTECLNQNYPLDTIILIDRFIASNFAYQSYGNNIDKSGILFNKIISCFQPIDLTIYLDINPKIGLERKLNQNQKLDLIEQSPIQYFNEVRKGYFKYFKSFHQQSSLILDATNPINKNLTTILEKIL